jgi:acetyl-CoA carboxylase carboxyltransferase component
MNSRDLGADLVLAWPGAEIGVLGARQAVGIVHRRTIEASANPSAEQDRLAAEYAEQHLSAEVAAAAGDVDEVVEPADTRRRLTWALSVLGTSNERNET